MFPYPATSDSESALLLVYNLVTGTDTPAADLANACWVLTGYGLSLGLPAVSLSAMSSVSDPYAALAKELAVVGEPRAERIGDGTLLKLIPWKVVMPLLLTILQKLLAGK